MEMAPFYATDLFACPYHTIAQYESVDKIDSFKSHMQKAILWLNVLL